MPFPPLCLSASLDADLSINDVLLRWPSAMRVLNAHGVDTCCGGAATLREAARNADISLETLLSEVALATAEP